MASMSACQIELLVQGALKVLNTANPWKKAEYTAEAVAFWQQGILPGKSMKDEGNPVLFVPDRPARDATVKVVAAKDMPRRGKGGTLASRIALLHSLVHIESWAVDLSWDIIARFGQSENMPRAFYDDFVKVASDEGRHFSILAARLEELGSSYGALPGHDGLWDSATETAGDLKARLAIEHCVHEARGLDVLPQTIARFRAGGDDITADLLEFTVYPEEVTHCAAGVRWFTYLCLKDYANQAVPAHSAVSACCDIGNSKMHEQFFVQNSSDTDDVTAHAVDAPIVKPFGEGTTRVHQEFHRVVRKHFRGLLKPPFNDKARAKAGFGLEWYMPLASELPTSVTTAS
eukprot:jgi/Mesen1/4323/ME000022S03611